MCHRAAFVDTSILLLFPLMQDEWKFPLMLMQDPCFDKLWKYVKVLKLVYCKRLLHITVTYALAASCDHRLKYHCENMRCCKCHLILCFL